MRGTRDLLLARGLRNYWFRHLLCTRSPAKVWKAMVYKRVEQHFDEDRETRMEGFTSLAHYINIKWWGVTDESRAVFSGEVGKRGALTCERYLDDTKERLGCRLKVLCRAGCLPPLTRILRECGGKEDWANCMNTEVNAV